MANDVDLFTQINNAVLDLQAAHSQSYERPLKTLARLLRHPDLNAANKILTEGLDLEAFLSESINSQGSMAGSAKLAWPDSHEKTLGLVLLLIEKFAESPDEIIGFGHTFFYSGQDIISGMRAATGQIIIPFVRDYKSFVMNHGNVSPKLMKPISNKVFVVHGHDEAARETVARFIEKLGFAAIILHERPNKGRTIITKFREEAADIGFAVVLMTPDDVGKAKDAVELKPRARQNVVFELAFFIGELGPDRVAALVKGDIERPSDFDGVVYISLDTADWKVKLAQELEEAGYNVDWQKAGRA